jgi:hypothetical protein
MTLALRLCNNGYGGCQGFLNEHQRQRITSTPIAFRLCRSYLPEQLSRRGGPPGRKAAGTARAVGDHHGEPIMWAAFVRQFAAYAITRRGKKLFALIGVLALCFGAALLIDMQFYVSASFAALLAGFAAVTYVVQHVKLKRAEHQRLLRKAEVARQRAIAAQARLERIDTAKSALRGAVTGAGRLVTDNVSIVANEALLMANETADTVTRSVQAVTGAVDTVWRTTLVYAVRGWRSLKA